MEKILLENEENMKRLRGDLSPYYTKKELNPREIDSNTISIVMTSSDRSKQVYFTLQTIQKSAFKNIHLVLVDDSTLDPIDESRLASFGINTDFITIDRTKKFWVNPCVNYNIGFSFIKGTRVIIQNSEVFHMGDILSVANNFNDDSYFVFDVIPSRNLETNEALYALPQLELAMENPLAYFENWYQHAQHHNRLYHFLTFTSHAVIKKLGGFSWDYSFSTCYDDDDFVLKLKFFKIPIINIQYQDRLLGIHQYHKKAKTTDDYSKIPTNSDLHHYKNRHILHYGKYPECSDDMTTYSQSIKRLFKGRDTKIPIVITITGIRPDFIRMSYVFKRLDQEFNHILIHTGQHYDKMLSDVFFDELQIRKPNFVLNTGKESSNHYEQLSYLSKAIPDLLKQHSLNPDLVLFLGDSNSAAVSLPLKKEGYAIGHIEAGMRSFDMRMLEEINRRVCDVCSDILFVYHEEYKRNLEKEGITKNVYVVGNTIVEPTNEVSKVLMQVPKQRSCILVDIHRPENFQYKDRLESILEFAKRAGEKYNLPVKLLYFKRLVDSLKTNNISAEGIELIPLMSYKEYLQTVYNCPFIISDSGTGQEEPALLNTPVVVPRDYTERPMSYTSNCSIQYKAAEKNDEEVFYWLDRWMEGNQQMDTRWLGDGSTSEAIIQHLKGYFGV